MRAFATASSRSVERRRRILAIAHDGFQTFGGIGHGEGADRAGRSLQRMNQRAGILRHGRKRHDQARRLGCEHRQHLAFEAGVAKRHAPEMIDIDRTVIGGERRRWHPVNPFEVKRHVDSPYFADPAAPFPPANHGIG